MSDTPEVKLQSLVLQILGEEATDAGLPSAPDTALSNLIAHKFIRLQELPSAYQVKPSESRQPFLQDLKKQLGMRLYYVFTDGTTLEIEQIFFHPYCEKVHPELLPVVRGMYDNSLPLKNFYWVPAYKNFPFKFGDVEYVILKILKNAQKMIINKRLDLKVLLPGESAPTEMESLEFYQEDKKFDPIQIRMEWLPQQGEQNETYGAGKLRLSFDNSSGHVYKNMAVVPETKKLRFHPLGVFLNEYQKYLNLFEGAPKEDLPKSSNYMLLPKNIQEVELSSHETISTIFAFLKDQESKLPFLKMDWKHKKIHLSASDYSPCLYISTQNEATVSLRAKEHSMEVFNLGFAAHHVVQGFLSSFKFLFDDEKSAIDKRGPKRARDLKFLKHSGLYSLYFYEISHFLLLDKSTDGKSFATSEEFLEYLFLRLGKALQVNEGNLTDESLKILCSKNINNALTANFYKMQTDFKSSLSVFSKDAEFEFAMARSEWLRFLFVILQDLLIQSQGELFQKARSLYYPLCSNLEKESNWQVVSNLDYSQADTRERIARYSLYSESLKKHIRAQSLFGLQDAGWRIFIHGKELESLGNQDFSWEFQVSDNSAAEGGGDKLDWFTLHPKFFLRGKELDVDSAIEFSQGGWLEHEGKVYVLRSQDIPSLRALEKFWQRIAQFKTQKAQAEKKTTYYQLPKNMTLELLALRSLGIQMEGGKGWTEVCEFYDSLANPREAELPDSIQGELKPYQKHGLRWLQDIYQLRLGGILADDMGLGKTLQSLAFLENLRAKGTLGRVLIVVPTSLVYNWKTESEKFTPQLPVRVFYSKEKDEIVANLKNTKDVVLVTTYGLLTEHEESFTQIAWNIHIYDEAQNIKNIVTKRATTARKIPAFFKVGLTGTPLENHLGEFFSIMDTVVPGSLGDYDEYRKIYMQPQVIKKTDIDFLRIKSKPLVLRRTKKEILKELPEKTISVLKIPFSEEQRRIYRDVALSWNQKVRDSITQVGESRSQLIMLTALLRLRQVCSDPAAIPGVSFPDEPPKMSLLRETLTSIVESGESAIVFTQFLTSLGRIQKILSKENIKVFTLDGKMPNTARQEVLKAFNDYPEGSVLAMTLKTGGVGLNLTKASYVFHMEPWWNPAVENQATDRVHRIGQEKHVQVYRYLMEESVEEKMEILKDRKASHFQALFQEVEGEGDLEKASSQLSRADFEFLLS